MLPHMIYHRPEDAQSLASAGRRSLGSLAAQNTPQYGRNDTPHAEDMQSSACAKPSSALGLVAAQNPLLGGDGTSTHSDCMGVGQLHGTGHVEVNDRTTPPIRSRSQQELYWRRKEEHRKRWGDRYRLPESFCFGREGDLVQERPAPDSGGGPSRRNTS